MAQLLKKFIAANAVDETKIRLSNNANLRARNAANSGDVSIFKVNASDRIEFASVPQATSDASSANDLVRYSQITGLLDGMKAKQAVAVASTANIDLGTAADPSPIDGYTLANGDRILLKDQTLPEENGIYNAVTATDPTTWTRASDYNAPSEIPGSYTVAQHGTVGQGVLYVTTSSPATIGVDPIVFVARSISTYTGGDMISLSGNAFSVDLATASGLESTNPGNAAGQLRIKLEASNPTLKFTGSNELAAKLDAAGAITSGASGLKVNVAASGGIEIATNALQIKSDTTTANTIGITTTSNGAGIKYDSNSFSESSETLALASGVAGDGLALTTGVLSVNVDGSTIETNTDALRVKAGGITENHVASSSFSTTGGLGGGSGTKFYANVDASSVKINGSNQIVAAVDLSEKFTLNGTDITNQYKDISHPATGSSASVNSISLSVVGGPEQEKGTDYTVSLTGGSGGVTRITFAGDLATGGAAELVSGDILMVKYSYFA